jgi:hypothetical protein
MGDKRALPCDALAKRKEAVTVFFDGEVRDGPQDFAQKVNNGADVTETRLRKPGPVRGLAGRDLSQPGLSTMRRRRVDLACGAEVGGISAFPDSERARRRAQSVLYGYFSFGRTRSGCRTYFWSRSKTKFAPNRDQMRGAHPETP